MATTRYLCRILVLDSEQKQSRNSTKYSNVLYVDKKQFVIGSGPDADIKITGPGVLAQHVQVSIDVPHLYIRNLGKGETLVSTYAVTSENMEPFKAGESIRLGQSKLVLFIELFKKFVEPQEESDAIVRESYEKVKTVETLVAEHKKELGLLNKQAKDLKDETDKEMARIIEEAKQKADEIQQSAIGAKEKFLLAAQQETILAAQKAEKDVERTIHELKLNSEETTRKLMDQARHKIKEIKAEAEQENEVIIASGQREAQLLIENAKKQATEVIEDGQKGIEALHQEQAKLRNEIEEFKVKRMKALEDLTSAKIELRNFDEQKQQAQRDFELEKERLRLSSEQLQKQLEIQESDKRAVEAQVENFKLHFNKMTAEMEAEKSATQAYMEKCKLETQQSILAKVKIQNEAEELQTKAHTLGNTIKDHQTELSSLNQRITDLKIQENNEREQMRSKLNKEYEARIEFEKNWHAKQRQIEQVQLESEKTAKAKLETLRLNLHAQTIVEKIKPLIGLEITSQFGEEQSLKFTPQLDKVISPIVHRCVLEEYEFRRENWETIRPTSYASELSQRAQLLKRQIGVTSFSVFFFMAAVLVIWAHASGFQLNNVSFITTRAAPEFIKTPVETAPRSPAEASKPPIETSRPPVEPQK